MNRRDFLASGAALAAALTLPGSAAFAGTKPRWVSGVGMNDGRFAMVGIYADLTVKPLLSADYRLHKTFPRPHHTEICAPARRPGNNFLVWREGGEVLEITAPTGRHYYGHGVFDREGKTLYLVENAYEIRTGVIGVYDAADNYRRLREFESGGIGPHDVRLHPDGRHLVVANGGIATHPKTGRAKLNLETMEPSLALIARESGRIKFQAALPQEDHGLSLRHIDVAGDGTVIVGAQDQLDRDPNVALVGRWKPGQDIEMFKLYGAESWADFNGYIGSVTLDEAGRIAAAASPRGGLVAFWDVASGSYQGCLKMADVCGVASAGGEGRFLITSGQGDIAQVAMTAEGPAITKSTRAAMRFDNHCQRV